MTFLTGRPAAQRTARRVGTYYTILFVMPASPRWVSGLLYAVWLRVQQRTSLVPGGLASRQREHNLTSSLACRASAGNGTVSATYGYLPTSDLVGSVLFKNGGTPVMTTTKSYGKLNRLTLTSTARVSGSVLSSFGYDYNGLNQRTKARVNDGSYSEFVVSFPC